MTTSSPIKNRSRALLVLPLAAISLSLASCGNSQAQQECPPVPPADVLVTNPPESYPGYPVGYIPKEQVPNSLTQLPPPPAADSTALAHDEAVAKAAFAMVNTPRGKMATNDSTLEIPPIAAGFSCSLGVPINSTDTPNLYRMLARLLADASNSTSAAKVQYKRPRPFMAHKEGTCTPNFEADLVQDPSYPSGHAAFGWIWGLALVEAAPERIDAVVARGRAVGDSRMICNAHWQSDVLQGRAMANVVYARVRMESAFRADMEAAKKDIAAARAKGLKPTGDCAAEAEALKQTVPGAL